MTSSLLKQATEAHDLYKRLSENIEVIRAQGWEQGRYLYKLKKNNLFKKSIGEGIDRWEDFLKLPEINISPSEANRLIQIYEQFILIYNFPPEAIIGAPIKNIHYLLPVLKEGKLDFDEASELLESAVLLTQKDFRDRLQEFKFPEKTLTYTYLIMKKCNETGNMTKVHGITSESVVEKLGL